MLVQEHRCGLYVRKCGAGRGSTTVCEGERSGCSMGAGRVQVRTGAGREHGARHRPPLGWAGGDGKSFFFGVWATVLCKVGGLEGWT